MAVTFEVAVPYPLPPLAKLFDVLAAVPVILLLLGLGVRPALRAEFAERHPYMRVNVPLIALRVGRVNIDTRHIALPHSKRES
jgi:hypothetical protein